MQLHVTVRHGTSHPLIDLLQEQLVSVRAGSHTCVWMCALQQTCCFRGPRCI